jgi:hypothetical protein
MTTIWNYILAHQVIAYAVCYYFFSSAIGALPMPDTASTKFYRWLFAFANGLAANISRLSASFSQSTAPTPPAPPKQP